MFFTPEVVPFRDVAPLAGAWIEIDLSLDFDRWHAVAPLAGAWIEIPVKTPLT